MKLGTPHVKRKRQRKCPRALLPPRRGRWKRLPLLAIHSVRRNRARAGSSMQRARRARPLQKPQRRRKPPQSSSLRMPQLPPPLQYAKSARAALRRPRRVPPSCSSPRTRRVSNSSWRAPCKQHGRNSRKRRNIGNSRAQQSAPSKTSTLPA